MTATGKSGTAAPASECATSPKPLGFHMGDPRTVMIQYRQYLLSRKKRWSSARSLIKYKSFIQSYLWAKRLVIASSRDPTTDKP